MADPWAGARAPEWTFTRLDNQDRPLGGLDGVTGGRVEIVTLSRLGGTAELSITDTGQDIDFMNDRVQVRYDPGISGVDPIYWGIWLFTTPKFSLNIVPRYEVSLLSKMAIIDEDTVIDSFSVDENTPIIPVVDYLIRSTGETRIALSDSGVTTTNALAWEPGESKLSIINDLLDSAGYRSLWCDGTGQFRVEPYLAPADLPTTRIFQTDEWSIVKPNWSREQDLASVPNRVIVYCEGTDEDPAIIGVAENWDLDSIFSIPNRNGRVITRREEVSDISSQGEADSLAQRYLVGGMSPVATLEVEHAIVPLDPGQRVRFIDGRPPVQRDATVQRMEMNFEFNAQCAATWREVRL